MTQVRIRPAETGDRQPCKALLSAAGLPIDDFDDIPVDDILVAESTSIVACIAVQQFTEIALLRSLVVSEAGRGHGVAAALVNALLDHLQELRTREVWLLTIDAEKYFSRHGFRIRDRDEAPGPIRDTKEFSDLCPGDAILMSRSLP